MFEGLLDNTLDIYVTTAANAYESSWATYCPGFFSKLGGNAANALLGGVEGSLGDAPPAFTTCLGDLYSVAWMENSESTDLTSETLEQQFELVKSRTSNNFTYMQGSHVMQYGALDIDTEVAGDYIGMYNNGTKPTPTLAVAADRDVKSKAESATAAKSPGASKSGGRTLASTDSAAVAQAVAVSSSAVAGDEGGVSVIRSWFWPAMHTHEQQAGADDGDVPLGVSLSMLRGNLDMIVQGVLAEANVQSQGMTWGGVTTIQGVEQGGNGDNAGSSQDAVDDIREPAEAGTSSGATAQVDSQVLLQSHTHHVTQRDAELLPLLYHAGYSTCPMKRATAHQKLQSELRARQSVDAAARAVASWLLQDASTAPALLTKHGWTATAVYPTTPAAVVAAAFTSNNVATATSQTAFAVRQGLLLPGDGFISATAAAASADVVQALGAPAGEFVELLVSHHLGRPAKNVPLVDDWECLRGMVQVGSSMTLAWHWLCVAFVIWVSCATASTWVTAACPKLTVLTCQYCMLQLPGCHCQ